MIEPTVFTETLGYRIRCRREDLGLSMEELAEKVGMSKTGIWQIEKGRSVPRANTIYRMCFALKISPNRLLTGGEEWFQIIEEAP